MHTQLLQNKSCSVFYFTWQPAQEVGPTPLILMAIFTKFMCDTLGDAKSAHSRLDLVGDIHELSSWAGLYFQCLHGDASNLSILYVYH